MHIGFHAVEPNFDKNMRKEEFYSAYNNVNKAIDNFAEQYSLAHVLRLHYFYCNLYMLNKVKESNFGLLGADSKTRDSYDLNKKENE